MREELLELAGKLRGEGLVGRHHQRGLAQRLDGLSHGVRLARAGDAQKHLVAIARPHAVDQRRDGLRLVACRFIRRNNLEAHRVTLNAEPPQLAANARASFLSHVYPPLANATGVYPVSIGRASLQKKGAPLWRSPYSNANRSAYSS